MPACHGRGGRRATNLQRVGTPDEFYGSVQGGGHPESYRSPAPTTYSVLSGVGAAVRKICRACEIPTGFIDVGRGDGHDDILATQAATVVPRNTHCTPRPATASGNLSTAPTYATASTSPPPSSSPTRHHAFSGNNSRCWKKECVVLHLYERDNRLSTYFYLLQQTHQRGTATPSSSGSQAAAQSGRS